VTDARHAPSPPEDPAPSEGSASSEGSAPAAAPALSIVALDDDADFRDFIRGTLEREGHEVRVAAAPDELYGLIESAMPDVVLLDIKMGPHHGEDVLSRVRSRWSKLCVVIVTGYPSLDSMRQTFKQDVFDYLAKPFSLEELRRVLSQAASAFGLGRRPQDRLRTELGRAIRLARTDRGWTLKELSESSGVSVSQLSSVERGAHLPSLESLLTIAEALGHTPRQVRGYARSERVLARDRRTLCAGDVYRAHGLSRHQERRPGRQSPGPLQPVASSGPVPRRRTL